MAHSSRALSFLFIAAFFFTCTVFPADAASPFVQRVAQALKGTGAQTLPPPASVEVAFSPDGGATELIVKTIGAAKKSVRVAAYSFTSRPILDALLMAHANQIDVEVILDHGQIQKDSHSVLTYLTRQKIPVRIDTKHKLQHDKYIVIDEKTIQTGSFNYTASAESHNSENVIVLWDAPEVAAAYLRNWKNLWDQAETYVGL